MAIYFVCLYRHIYIYIHKYISIIDSLKHQSDYQLKIDFHEVKLATKRFLFAQRGKVVGI